VRRYSVTLYGQTMEESVRKRAEELFAAALESICPNVELLRLMQDDEKAALDAGVAHFEDCKSAWQAICKMALKSVEANLNWRIAADGCYFEVDFPPPPPAR
jgi:hypothetical protein